MKNTIDIRKQNTLNVIKVISRRGKVTKNDVAYETGLTVMTINTLMNSLLNEGILCEEGNAESLGGRPASLYRLNAPRYSFAGVNIDADQFSVQLRNLEMQLQYSNEVFTDKGMSCEMILEKVKLELLHAMYKAGLTSEQLLGISVVFPGIADTDEGVHSLFEHSLRWENVPVKQFFNKEFGVKVLVEKDTYASVLYLKHEYGNELQNAISLIIKGGIGGGILINGNIFRGENGVAGEFGHMSVETNGDRCRCGDSGCLEAYASDIGIIQRAQKLLASEHSVLREITQRGQALDIDMIVKAYNMGDTVCKYVLETAAGYLSMAISNIIRLYDPSHIILESSWVRNANGLFAMVQAAVEKKSILRVKKKVRLMLSVDSDIYLKGATMLAFEYFMNNIEDNKLLH